jgi:hypothetical protein
MECHAPQPVCVTLQFAQQLSTFSPQRSGAVGTPSAKRHCAAAAGSTLPLLLQVERGPRVGVPRNACQALSGRPEYIRSSSIICMASLAPLQNAI